MELYSSTFDYSLVHMLLGDPDIKLYSIKQIREREIRN